MDKPERYDIGLHVYVALVRTSQGIFLMTDASAAIAATTHLREALDWFERTYQRWNQGSGEMRASIAVNWITFQPSIVFITGNYIQRNVVSFPAKMYVIRSVSGSMHGFLCHDTAYVKELWDEGVKPRLV